MTDDEIATMFANGLHGVLSKWRHRLLDELRAVHVGFDSCNTEISISLLTDKEPSLDQRHIEPFDEEYGDWPTADWRLHGVNHTHRHTFPDCAELYEWMKATIESVDDDRELNTKLRRIFFEVLSGDRTRQILASFHRVSCPLKLRVAWFFDSSHLSVDARMTDA
jgi:hypothetical protein